MIYYNMKYIIYKIQKLHARIIEEETRVEYNAQMNMARAYITEDERKEYQREYKQSDAAKEYHRQYNQKDAVKEYQQQYLQTDAAKEWRRQWEQTDARKEYRRQYYLAKKAEQTSTDNV